MCQLVNSTNVVVCSGQPISAKRPLKESQPTKFVRPVGKIHLKTVGAEAESLPVM